MAGDETQTHCSLAVKVRCSSVCGVPFEVNTSVQTVVQKLDTGP